MGAVLKLPMTTKACRSCKDAKPVSEFGVNPRYRDGLQSYCMACQSDRANLYNKRARQDWAARLMQNVRSAYADKRRAKVQTWQKSDLTVEFLRELYMAQNGCCYWTEIPMTTEIGSGLTQISLDRLDTARGYTRDNVTLTCVSANLARSDAEPAEFKKFLRLLVAAMTKES